MRVTAHGAPRLRGVHVVEASPDKGMNFRLHCRAIYRMR